jgi:hypothetical protein
MPLPTKHADVEPEANSGEVHATECRIRSLCPGRSIRNIFNFRQTKTPDAAFALWLLTHASLEKTCNIFYPLLIPSGKEKPTAEENEELQMETLPSIVPSTVHTVGLIVPTLMLTSKQPLPGAPSVLMQSRLKYTRVRKIYHTAS